MALLYSAGVIPEVFAHDSSEEKIYAKAMDELVAEALCRAGYVAAPITTRSNAADVHACWQGPSGHSVVIDTKSLRLSRTALNPKDYKVSAVSEWRGQSEYACVIAPMAGYPLGRNGDGSRLYRECLSDNVLAITYAHLGSILEHVVVPGDGLAALWDLPRIIRGSAGQSITAERYWREIDAHLTSRFEIPAVRWCEARRKTSEASAWVLSEEQDDLFYIRSELERLPKEALLARLLETLRLDERAALIEDRVEKVGRFCAALEQCDLFEEH